MLRKTPALTPALMQKYITHLREQERSAATIQKYTHDLNALLKHLGGAPLTKAALIDWKQQLTAVHAPATVNSMLAATNGFLRFMGWGELAVKPLKIQKALFTDERRELTRAEYVRLVRAAERQENQRHHFQPGFGLHPRADRDLPVSHLRNLSRGALLLSSKNAPCRSGFPE